MESNNPMNLEIISQIPLFANIPKCEIQALQQESQVDSFLAGEVLLGEGLKNDFFYILVEGKVEIIKSLGTPDERCLGIINQHSIIGEMSRFRNVGTHTASVRGITDTRLLRVPFTWLESMLVRYPYLSFDMLRLYSSRLAHSENLTIEDLHEKNRQLTKAYEDLKIAQAAMIEKEKLDQEMRLAGKIQRTILPKLKPNFLGLDFGALMIPAKQVGGDFYDFIPLDDHRMGIVIGDVCDKGMSAAILMALTYSAVRMEALRNDNPGNTLRQVNRHLVQIDCSDMFVTLLYGILDCNNFTFNYARAGHPKPILLSASNTSLPVPYKTGQAVGIFEQFDLDEACIQIPNGGTLIVYSDGLSETVEDQEGSPGLPQFCLSRVKDEALGAQELCEALWREVGGSAAESLIKDDFTVVVVKSLILK